MEIETKVISIETIKPSSPTLKSQQKHQLSFLDQLAPRVFSPIIYFYSSNPSIPNSQKSNHLKKSLSEVLSLFYPLAGHLVDNLYVDCNDGGAPFVEAEADCDLLQVITNPDPKKLNKFIPYKSDESQDFCMAVQATYFRCGGLAVGLQISHEIADALSMVMFASTWSAVTRNGGLGSMPIPKFEAAAYFPPRDVSGFIPSRGTMKEELVTKVFTFPGSKLSVLREKYAAVGSQRRPTRVEALSAFIWNRFISATGAKAEPNKIYDVRHAVNLRTRVDPPLSVYHFGNIYGLSTAKPAAVDEGAELLQKVQEAMKAVYDGYVAQLKEGEDEHMQSMNEIMAQADKAELVSFTFTGLCGFPLYEADFGWGKPVWVGSPGFPYNNLALFTDTKSGGGIEALIHLRKQDMDKFEADMELQILINKD
ncbi:hypothetical protein C2S52_016144 [Perilla frutescens var. hirtella]|nr:hypothetical protein C2S52_016144 [Perilla frutescens var. hirtella]